MAIRGITSRDGIGLSLFVPEGRQNEAAAFYLVAFGASSPRHWIHPTTGEIMAIDIKVGDATFTVCGANPKREADPAAPGPCSVPSLGRGSTIFQLCVDDIDDTVERAVNAGATIRTPVADADWGDRVATIIDPFGHIWALASISREVSVAEFNARGNVQLIEAA
jgi:PhnB protein